MVPVFLGDGAGMHIMPIPNVAPFRAVRGGQVGDGVGGRGALPDVPRHMRGVLPVRPVPQAIRHPGRHFDPFDLG